MTSHLDLRCLQKPVIIAYGSERVKVIVTKNENCDQMYC